MCALAMSLFLFSDDCACSDIFWFPLIIFPAIFTNTWTFAYTFLYWGHRHMDGVIHLSPGIIIVCRILITPMMLVYLMVFNGFINKSDQVEQIKTYDDVLMSLLFVQWLFGFL